MPRRKHYYTKLDWKITKEASELLGISSSTLLKLRRDGYFKHGKHYRVISHPMSASPRYQWHVPRIEEWLATPVAKRYQVER